MSRDRIRTVRRTLVVVLVAVTGMVVWSLRRPGTPPGPAAPSPGSGAGRGTTLGDVSFLRFREGSREVAVKARAMTGQEGSAVRLEGVEFKLPFAAEGREETATITADECLYEAARERASFRGNVRVVTTDGFEMETARLDHLGDQGVVRSGEDVRFRRGRASGSGRGLEYRRVGGVIELRENVKLRFEEERGPPTDVEAASARAVRPERRVWLEGGVRVKQGARELQSRRLLVHLAPDLQAIERAAAIENVDVRIGGGVSMSGETGAEGGEKRVRCRKLHMIVTPGGAVQEAIAVNGASLEVLPGPGDPAERRVLASRLIRFVLDAQGRLASLQARAGGAKGLRTTLRSDPIPPAAGRAWRTESRSLVARFDPVSGAVSQADLEGGFAFEEPGRKAWGRQAVFDERASRLTLTGDARVVDEAQGSELSAQRIELDTRTHGVRARENVRHTLKRRNGSRGGAVLGGEEPTVLLSPRFEYDPATKTARYLEGALLRSGKDEIRAPTIVIEEPAEGRRRLTATGGVNSTLHPRPRKGEAREKAPVAARSREMVYEEAAQRIVYTGDVEIRQGDIVTLSPEAVVTLTADGGAVDRLTAGSPAEVRQGVRRATGERASYAPEDETMVLVGERVVLQDVDRQVVGRILIFSVGSDRIRVDGREEVRTEAVFKRKEPQKP